MKIKLGIAVLCLLTLCGCAGEDPNEKYMVSAVGFSAVSDQVEVTLQIFSAESQEEKILLHGRGQTVAAALEKVKASLIKTPSFGHCEAVVISDNLDAKRVDEVLHLADTLGISMQSRIVCSNSVSNLLGSNLSGSEIVALIKQNDKNFGFGGNTALFEIKTALIAAGGDFALPYIRVYKEQPTVDGLLYYSSSSPTELLDPEESRRYAKNKGLSKGELV